MGSENQFDPKNFSDSARERARDRFKEHLRNHKGARIALTAKSGVWPGLVLVVIGTAILLDHMGVVPADRLWKYWPVLLILVGAVQFVESCNRLFSVMLMLVGTLFLLGNLGYVRFSWSELWPVILIVLGVAMIWGRMTIPTSPARVSGAGEPNTVNATTMFGGVERRITTSNFAGGTVTATFGGVELDFRGADIEGEEAVLYVEALFGGIELVIPERWTAIFEGQSLFGGYSDQTRPPLPDVPGAPPKKRLILRGRAVFGGITVQN